MRPGVPEDVERNLWARYVADALADYARLNLWTVQRLAWRHDARHAMTRHMQDVADVLWLASFGKVRIRRFVWVDVALALHFKRIDEVYAPHLVESLDLAVRPGLNLLDLPQLDGSPRRITVRDAYLEADMLHYNPEQDA